MTTCPRPRPHNLLRHLEALLILVVDDGALEIQLYPTVARCHPALHDYTNIIIHLSLATGALLRETRL